MPHDSQAYNQELSGFSITQWISEFFYQLQGRKGMTKIRKRLLLIAFVAGIGLLLAPWVQPNAQAVPFSNLLALNTLNTFEDQDRESIVDIDKSGTISKWDVFFGFLRLDDRSVPTAGADLDQTYVVFSFELEDIQSFTVGTNNVYQFTFGKTDSALAVSLGLDLASLHSLGGGLLPAIPSGNELFALYEGYTGNLLTTSPGDKDGDGQLTMFDFIQAITETDLQLVAGLRESDDHWYSNFTVPTAADPILTPTLLDSATLGGGLGGTNSFHAGLSVLWQDILAMGGFLELVQDNVEFPPSLHEIVISNGGVSGASDLLYAFGGSDVSPFFADITSGAETYAVWAVSSNADASVYPTPEPATMLLLGSGLAFAGFGARRKMKK
jgi:hypothetical protein